MKTCLLILSIVALVILFFGAWGAASEHLTSENKVESFAAVLLPLVLILCGAVVCIAAANWVTGG